MKKAVQVQDIIGKSLAMQEVYELILKELRQKIM
jgi:hypothetical protein